MNEISSILTRLLLDFVNLSIFGSLSLRSCNIDTMPFDYECRAGFKTRWTYMYELYEREQNQMFYGHLRKVDIGFLHFKDFYREAQDINTQNFDILYPYKFLRIGMGYVLNNWSRGKPCISMQAEKRYFETEYRQAKRYYNLDIKVKYPFEIKRLTIVPKVVYYIETDTDQFWQTRLEVRYKL